MHEQTVTTSSLGSGGGSRSVRRRASSLAAAVASIALVIGASSTADARVPDRIRDIERDIEITPNDRIEALDLSCEGFLDGDVASVGCRWEVPSHPRAAEVRLVRHALGADGARTTVFRTSELSQNSYIDTPVRAGVRYLYAVRAVDANGRLVGASRPVSAGVRVERPSDVEALRLNCEQISGLRVSCSWSDPSVEGRVLTLWRSVDGAARERVVSFPNPFPTSYVDGVPSGSSHVVYSVIVTDGADEIVARSRAEHVRLRTDEPVDTRPVDTRPVDTRPVDTRPVDTRPVDTRPVDTRPVDTRPVDTRPVDTRPVDTRPVDTRPVDTRPVDTRPVDTRPVETDDDARVDDVVASTSTTPPTTTAPEGDRRQERGSGD